MPGPPAETFACIGQRRACNHCSKGWLKMPDLSNVMPIHIGITLFLGFFSATLGIFAARAIARCLRDVYEYVTRDRIPTFDATDHVWR